MKLRNEIIKLAHANPDLREDLLPLLSDKEASADSLNAAIKSWWASLAKKINGKSGMEVKSISETGLEIVYGVPYPYGHMRVFAEKGMIEFDSKEFKGASRLTMDMSQKYIADSILKIPTFMARLAKTKSVNQYFIEGQYQQQYGGGQYFEAFDTEREMRKEFKDIVRKPGHYEIEPRTLVMYVEFEDGSTKAIR